MLADAVYATGADIAQLVAHEPVDRDLVSSMMDLFDGHPKLAMLWKQGRAPGFYRVGDIRRRTAFKAHLTGYSTVGVYPFRGVDHGCGCKGGNHTCSGGGCNYVCIDIDAHDGPQDADARLKRIREVAKSHDLRTCDFTSRSGRGAHSYVYFDETVPTSVANSAGRFLASEAGADRCDIIPSANHYKGFGTLHALPMSPSFEPGGGLLLDGALGFVTDNTEAVARLREAHRGRVPAALIHNISARVPIKSMVRRPRKRKDYTPEKLGKIIKSIAALHPQFRAIIKIAPEAWKGGRSARDAALAGILRRQPLSRDVCAYMLVDIPGTKAHERGLDYAYALLDAQDEIAQGDDVIMAGQKVKRGQVGPWFDRLAPPERYEGDLNPWWNPLVQMRLRDPKNRNRGTDGIVLAYLIDRFYRGRVKRRQFYASYQNLSDALKIAKRTVGNSVKRIGERFADIMTVIPGVPHKFLRIATAFRVNTQDHFDPVDWSSCEEMARNEAAS